jgi:hypothetical protein
MSSQGPYAGLWQHPFDPAGAHPFMAQKPPFARVPKLYALFSEESLLDRASFKVADERGRLHFADRHATPGRD